MSRGGRKRKGLQNTPSPDQKTTKKHKEKLPAAAEEESDGFASESGSETEVGRVAESARGGSTDLDNTDTPIIPAATTTHSTLDQVVKSINQSIENLAAIMRSEMAATQKANVAAIAELKLKFEDLEAKVNSMQDQIAEKDLENGGESVVPHLDAINRRIDLLQQIQLNNFSANPRKNPKKPRLDYKGAQLSLQGG